MTESRLYERLGGAFTIAAVFDHFSEAVVRNPIVGQTSENALLREWHTNMKAFLANACAPSSFPRETALRPQAERRHHKMRTRDETCALRRESLE